MATQTALSTEQFGNQQRHIKCIIYASGYIKEINMKHNSAGKPDTAMPAGESLLYS
jgi:hypothetical protein